MMDDRTIAITDVTDIIVPIYSVIVLLFIIAYQKSPETKSEDRYFLKKVIKTTEKKEWREVITGFFHQTESDGFDDWLKFLEKPYPIRLIAPLMFHKIHFDIKLTATEFTVERSQSPTKDKADAPVTMTLGTCKEDAPVFNYQAAPDDSGEWRGWVVEGEQKVHAHFVPTNPNANPTMHITREVVDQDTLLVTWQGERKGKKCEMTSTYRRVDVNMLRAEQLALIQEANQQLLAIRQQEMEYYTNTFASFGTQGSLLAGFTLGALTGLDMRDFDQGIGLSFWKGFFHILAAVAMGASIHCILTTTFANIYGPNLALRGPSGSMVRAVKGMIAEKSGIFLSFIVCLICFQFITLAATWVKMQTYAACIATLVLTTGATYWYKYCLRIYNRFKFIEPDIEWRNSDGGSEMIRSTTQSENTEEDSMDSSQQASQRQTFQIDASMVANNNKQASMKNQKAIGDSLRKEESSELNSNKKWYNRKDKDKDKDKYSGGGGGAPMSRQQQSGGTEVEVGGSTAPAPMHLFHEGYLSKMGKAGLLSKGEWTRRYFVLRGSDMFYYRSREDFEKDPSLSIKNRPISISNYSVVQISLKDKPPFEFKIQTEDDGDDRRTWHFRCDMAEEMTLWIEAFSKAVHM